jgi:hypothetical protein
MDKAQEAITVGKARGHGKRSSRSARAADKQQSRPGFPAGRGAEAKATSSGPPEPFEPIHGPRRPPSTRFGREHTFEQPSIALRRPLDRLKTMRSARKPGHPGFQPHSTFSTMSHLRTVRCLSDGRCSESDNRRKSLQGRDLPQVPPVPNPLIYPVISTICAKPQLAPRRFKPCHSVRVG